MNKAWQHPTIREMEQWPEEAREEYRRAALATVYFFDDQARYIDSRRVDRHAFERMDVPPGTMFIRVM